MPQLTLNLPDALMPYVNLKASQGHGVISLLEATKWQDEHPDFLAGDDRAALEEILEERDKGPFITLPENWQEQVLEKARLRVKQMREDRAHA